MAETSSNSGDVSAGALAVAAERVLGNLAELEPELVSAGVFGADGRAIAVTSGSPDWPGAASRLLEALEAGSETEDFDSAHVASSDGEVFAVTEAGISLVAVTGRFVLASLASYDLRMALRDVAAANVSPEAGNGGTTVA